MILSTTVNYSWCLSSETQVYSITLCSTIKSSFLTFYYFGADKWSEFNFCKLKGKCCFDFFDSSSNSVYSSSIFYCWLVYSDEVALVDFYCSSSCFANLMFFCSSSYSCYSSPNFFLISLLNKSSISFFKFKFSFWIYYCFSLFFRFITNDIIAPRKSWTDLLRDEKKSLRTF